MSEVRLSPKARAKYLRDVQKARAIGQIEKAVYEPFIKAWQWFNKQQTLKTLLVFAALVAAFAFAFSLEDLTTY